MIDKFLFMPAELTAGAEYLNNTLTDISGYRTRDVDQKPIPRAVFYKMNGKTTGGAFFWAAASTSTRW